jgi:CRP-like cAMP-binding protein
MAPIEKNASRHAPNLLANLPPDIQSQLLTLARPTRLAAGQVLFLADDPGDGCYLIEDGLLKVTVMSPSGGERILALLGAGALVGELSMIDGAPRSSSAYALRESSLRFIGRADFNQFGERSPQLFRHLSILLARRLRDTDAVVAASFLSLKGRVARALLSLANAFGHDVGNGRIVIRQKFGQSDLGAMAGIARETVSRILNEWKRDKVVSRISSYYCVENRAVLEREAEL